MPFSDDTSDREDYCLNKALERGGIDVVQPSTVRSGGIAEIKGLLCITHSWNGMVGVAAVVHLAAVLPNMPYIEVPLAFPSSPLITELRVPGLKPDANGWIEVPRQNPRARIVM